MNEDLDYNYNGDVIVRKAASPSRARPSDRAIAQAFFEILRGSSMEFERVMKRAAELDTTPEARAGDCDASLGWIEIDQMQDVIDFLTGEGTLNGYDFSEKNHEERGAYWWRKHLSDRWGRLTARLTTKATP